MIQGYCKEKSDAIHPWGFMVNHHVEDSMVLPSSSTVGRSKKFHYLCMLQVWGYYSCKLEMDLFFLLKIDENTQSSASPQEFLHMGVSLTL